jgi:hexosaminidase
MTVASRLLALIAFITIATPARAADDPRLIPKPREITVGELIPLSRAVSIDGVGNDDDRFAAREFAESLTDRGIRATLSGGGGYRISLLRTTSAEAKSILTDRDLALNDAMIAEGYVLIVGKHEAHVIGATASGVFYGLQTLKQLIRTDGAVPRIQTATIRDWPALKYRGFQDDLS